VRVGNGAVFDPCAGREAAFFSRWLTRRPPGNLAESIFVFCFPHAGAGASCYRSWPETRGPFILLPVQPPGRESRYREPTLIDARFFAEAFVAAAAPMLESPFALFGHSMGALLAYEIARLVRASGDSKLLGLFVSGARPPHLPDRQPPVRHLPETELIATVRRWNGVPDEILQNPELLSIVVPVLRADLTLCETYVCDGLPGIDVPITAFGGRADPKIAVEEVEGWKTLTSADCEVHFYDAGHFYLESHRAEILATIESRLTAAAAHPASIRNMFGGLR
jgi:medium-chain acyl-[acyl-carrier-protein] hydrolase